MYAFISASTICQYPTPSRHMICRSFGGFRFCHFCHFCRAHSTLQFASDAMSSPEAAFDFDNDDTDVGDDITLTSEPLSDDERGATTGADQIGN
jgi:hypothetical protein